MDEPVMRSSFGPRGSRRSVTKSRSLRPSRSRRRTPVFVRQGNVVATSFHPELTDDARLHRCSLIDPGSRSADVRAFEVVDHQAQEGRQGRQARQAVRQAGAAIEIAAREGGVTRPATRRSAPAVQKAKDASMPNDNIDRAIKRGTGEVEGVDYDEIWYEGYAPGGVALYVQCLTDNRNRAASDVRADFTRNDGSLGEPGSVAYLFEQKGYILVTGDEDDVILAALEGGAEDVRASETSGRS